MPASLRSDGVRDHPGMPFGFPPESAFSFAGIPIYVHGSPIDKLMGQVTCGNVDLERAVALPKGLFPLVLKRLSESSSSTQYKSPVLASWYSRHLIDAFLASRCSRDFLVQYIGEHSDVLGRVSKPGRPLSWVSEVDLAIRLHEFGLLPEEYRQGFVRTVVSYAIEGEDLYALEDLKIQSVFNSAELAEFRGRVRAELVPNLADVRRNRQNERSSEQRPDEYMEPLLESFSGLKKEFADDPAILSKIDQEVQLTQEWIAEKMADDPKEDRPARSFGEVDTPAPAPPPAQDRGIFDDVDE